jgi:hypothetical protein
MNVEMHDFRASLVLELVQQPCSNPGKSPEMLGNVSTEKIVCLREFCKPQKPLRKARS